MRAWLAAGILSSSLGPQVTVQFPDPREGVSRRAGDAHYGEPVTTDLASIAFNEGVYQRQHVRTRGRLGVLEANRYFVLSDGHARVLVLAVPEIAYTDLLSMLGRDLDVLGIVRTIREKQYTRGIDADLLEDPTLPVLPAPRIDWPRVSLTVLGFSEREGGSGRSRAASLGSASALLANPPSATGKLPRVVIVGLFRGRNLYGDLPASSRRKPADWVLKEGDTAFWVTGKEPRGKGFALDPGYQGDTARWLEVEGKPEVVGGVLYLHASQLRLAKPPKVAEEPEP